MEKETRDRESECVCVYMGVCVPTNRETCASSRAYSVTSGASRRRDVFVFRLAVHRDASSSARIVRETRTILITN